MWRASIPLILVGCNSLLGIHALANTTTGDGNVNDDSLVPNDVIPTTDGTACFGSGGFTVCLTALPTASQVVSGTIDTDASPECYSGYDVPVDHPWCVVVGTMIAVSSGAPLRATGAKPLVLLATGDLTIAGGATIDVSSHAGGANGPAAGVNCAAVNDGGNTSNPDSGGAGGPGGSFGSTGGRGGDGDSSAAGGTAAAAASTPTGLYGGCPGGRGAIGASGDSCVPTTSGPPGAGGGAIYLIAGGTVRVDGSIAASGAGGGPGLIARGGGSGGGSGGLIAIWSATTVSGTGLLITSGGGGGGGADHCGNANPGGDPAIDMTAGGAAGLGADTDCPNGGVGGSGTSVGIDGSTGGSKGGSAGGGGVGYVMIHSGATFPGTISGVTTTF